MGSLIVFAHMMKTAGASLTKNFIENYGKKVHIVPGGIKMNNDGYGAKELKCDLNKMNGIVRIVSGHPFRPYKDFSENGYNFKWITLMRRPKKRYVSHFLFDYKWTENFGYPKYSSMQEKNIIEWEEIEGYANYQTKFLAGEVNFDKAVEVLEKKMAWVGRVKEFSNSIYSLKHHMQLSDLHVEIEQTNSSLADKKMKQNILESYQDFISEKNRVDIKLYKYFKNNIWPNFKIDKYQKNKSSILTDIKKNEDAGVPG